MAVIDTAVILDGPQTQLDNSVRVFDQYYNFQVVVDSNHYEIVYSYFVSVTNTLDTAKNFTTMLFRISNITGENPLTLLEYMQGGTKLQVTSLMAYYLNGLKSKTTLYGISVTPSPNQTIQRNIVI
jgi:hypothetical protein